MRLTKTISLIAITLLVSAGAAFALISQNSTKSKPVSSPRVAIASSGSGVKIQSSKGGGAILVAKDMVPGETRSDTVSIKNTGKVPVTLSMGASSITANPANASSIFQTKLFETGNAGSPLYSGSVKNFTGKQIGDLSPGKSRNFTLQAILPASAGNEAENICTSFNVDWKAVEKTTGPPPKECKLRKIRARFFIFRNPKANPFVRMVSRYQANSGGKVKVTFYWRHKKGKKKYVRGKKIGSMISTFKKTKGKKWRLNRVWLRKTPKQQLALFRHKDGFYATLKPFKTKSYCTNYLNVELTILKNVDAQHVWFQAGSSFKFEPGTRR